MDRDKPGPDRNRRECSSIKISGEEDVALSFPQRLMEVLDDERYSDIISWLESGRSFVIHNRSRFVEEILPKHLNKSTKFSSFARKLNRWGFGRVPKGPEAGAYFHPLFQKGGHKLLAQMGCQSTPVPPPAARGGSGEPGLFSASLFDDPEVAGPLLAAGVAVPSAVPLAAPEQTANAAAAPGQEVLGATMVLEDGDGTSSTSAEQQMQSMIEFLAQQPPPLSDPLINQIREHQEHQQHPSLLDQIRQHRLRQQQQQQFQISSSFSQKQQGALERQIRQLLQPSLDQEIQQQLLLQFQGPTSTPNQLAQLARGDLSSSGGGFSSSLLIPRSGLPPALPQEQEQAISEHRFSFQQHQSVSGSTGGPQQINPLQQQRQQGIWLQQSRLLSGGSPWPQTTANLPIPHESPSSEQGRDSYQQFTAGSQQQAIPQSRLLDLLLARGSAQQSNSPSSYPEENEMGKEEERQKHEPGEEDDRKPSARR